MNKRTQPRPGDRCPECNGHGGDNHGDCEHCYGEGIVLSEKELDTKRSIAHETAAENGDPCPNRTSECPECTASALDAGIPLSVIQGKTKLSDHFSPAEIARNSGDKELADELDNEELIAAGRGHLVRR